jgi:hypothetical protein
METRCAICGGELEKGRVQARNTGAGMLAELGMVVSRFAFVRPGTTTSMNPIDAFAQGMREEPEDATIPLFAIRCRSCGRVELVTDPD